MSSLHWAKIKIFTFSPKHLIFKREFPWVSELLRHDSAAQSLLHQKKKRQRKRGRERETTKETSSYKIWNVYKMNTE